MSRSKHFQNQQKPILKLRMFPKSIKKTKNIYRDNNKPIHVTHNIDLAPPNVYKYYICSKVNKSYKLV